MRRIITPGAKCCAFCCPFCGQVEILTEGDELNKCANCGTEMLPAEELKKQEEPKPTPEEIKEAAAKAAFIDPRVEVIERPPQIAPKKKGRPPKQPTLDKPQRKGDEERCGNCGKALRAVNGYTCKETCEGMRAGDWCEKYKRGTPID